MFSGSMVALITPMHNNGDIDWHTLEKLIEWHIESGTDAIVSVGTTGESATLTFSEHQEVLRFTVEIAKKRLPIIAGAGSNTTQRAAELTLFAYENGCDATLHITPYYIKPPQRGLYAHFKQVAQAAPLPVILYNVPGRTACEIEPETCVALTEFDNIIGIKEATPIARLHEMRQIFPQGHRFKIFSGEDGHCCEAANAGLIDGVISVTANVAPAQMHDMMQKALNGDTAGANAIDAQLAPLHDALFCETNPIPVKWALYRMGKAEDGIRLPLVSLDSHLHKGIEKALNHARII